MEIEFGARSDVGRARGNNEDCLRTAPEMNLFVLSDGMGGQSSGEVASRLTAETVIAKCREAAKKAAGDFAEKREEGISDAGAWLTEAICAANAEVRQEARANSGQTGMGATVVAAMLRDERASIAHVGDSRAYRLRNGDLEQLTRDHSFVAEQVRNGLMSEEEAGQSNLQNVLLRAVGVDEQIQVEVNEELFVEGDTLLLCSDGLTKELTDTRIAEVLEEIDDPQEAAERLVELANKAGGSDNITVIVLRQEPRLAGAFERIGRWFKGS